LFPVSPPGKSALPLSSFPKLITDSPENLDLYHGAVPLYFILGKYGFV
jgi:hypothetical protein